MPPAISVAGGMKTVGNILWLVIVGWATAFTWLFLEFGERIVLIDDLSVDN